MKKILVTTLPSSLSAPPSVLNRLVGVALETLRVEGGRFIVSATEIASAMLNRTDKDDDSVSIDNDWQAARWFSNRNDDEVGIPFEFCRPIVE